MVNKWIIRLLIFCAVLLNSTAHSSAYYARVGGNDWPCGDKTNPCGSIQTILDYDAGGAPISVAEGVYTESLVFDATEYWEISLSGGWNNDFSRQTCAPENTILHPTSHVLIDVDVDVAEDLAVSLSCLSLVATDDSHQMGISLDAFQSLAELTLDRTILSNFAGQSVYLFGDAGSELSATFEKTVIKNAFQASSQSQFTGSGIYAIAKLAADLDITLQNSLLHDNKGATAGTLSMSAEGPATTLDLSLLNTTITNNQSTTSTNSLDTGGILVSANNSGETNVTLENSIVWGNSTPVTADDISIIANTSGTASLSAQYSILGAVNTFSNGTYSDIGNNMNINPLLDNHYHLQGNSPAIDTARCGHTILANIYRRDAPYDDIDGEERPGFGALGGCDIGADEHQGSMCLPIRSKSGKYALICL